MERPSIIDTHCHLDMPQFESDRDEVIQRARATGLEAIITVGSDIESSISALEIANKYDFIYCSVGVHPHEASRLDEHAIDRLRGLLSKKKIVAIGETGLDYHYMHSPKDVQKEAFRRQIRIALKNNLPLIVHSREAEKDTIDILKEEGVTKGVMHCFSSSPNMAEDAMRLGLYISIAGPVTFKNAKNLKEIAKSVPDEYLLIETDSPYLTPEPLRGKRNEPSFIVHTADEIARLRGVSIEDIYRITSLNAKRLFGIGEIPKEGTITYKIRQSLYLNITNRCTNRCSFCIRYHSDFVKGHMLRLRQEPSPEEIKSQIGDPKRYKEIVFCGYGEPLIRLDLVKDVASWIKSNGGRVRINTNGHGNLIHGRDILPELQGLVDSISISLDAHDEETYERLCAPAFKGAFRAVLEFIKESVRYIPDVELSVVDIEGVDIKKCKEIADSLGVRLRVRGLDVVG